MLWARILANVIAVFHALFVTFLVFGMVAIIVGLMSRWSWVRNFSFRVLHLSAIGVMTAQARAGIRCPLTVLENDLRKLAGQGRAGQGRGPIRARSSVLGTPAHLLPPKPWVFACADTLFGLEVLAAFVLMPPRWPGRPPDHRTRADGKHLTAPLRENDR